MVRLLANENVPSTTVDALRHAGHDVAWIAATAPGADDRTVLATSVVEARVLLTFDKDFGELVYRLGQDSSSGVILLRPKLTSPDYLARFALDVLSQPVEWQGHFSVAQEGHLRVLPLPA